MTAELGLQRMQIAFVLNDEGTLAILSTDEKVSVFTSCLQEVNPSQTHFFVVVVVLL